MYVPELVELVHGGKHLADIESGVFLFENARVVEQSAEIAPGNIFHGKIDMLGVLERIQQANQPCTFGGGENIAFDKNMPNLGGLFILNKQEPNERVPRPS